MRLSDTYAKNYLDFLMGKTPELTAPAMVWAGLSTTDPETPDGKGTFTEVSGNGYGRILLSVRGESYPDDVPSASGREIENKRQLAWPKATGAYTVKGIGLFISETGGTPFASGFIGTAENHIAVNVQAGAIPMFEAEGFNIFCP